MRSICILFLLFVVSAFISCSDDDQIIVDEFDTEAPVFTRVSFIDSPFIPNDPGGDIEDGSNHTISIESGFQVRINVRDQSNLAEGEIYFTVNNDPDIRETMFSKELIINNNESSLGFIHRVDKIWLGPDDWYFLQPGDTYQFFARYEDEFGNESTYSWTADLIE